MRDDELREVPAGADPDLPEKTKKAVEHVGEAVQEAMATPKPEEEIDPEELKRYPSYYRIRDIVRKMNAKAEGPWGRGLTWHRHHDDERYDAVAVHSIERYKTSGLSGDEWRFSIVAQIYWKGHVIGSRGMGSFEAAIRILDHWINYMQEHLAFEHNGEHDWVINWPDDKLRAEYCFQPGCCEKAVNTFRLKELYTRDGTTKKEMFSTRVVRYCLKHSGRGNSHMTDCDQNLELIDGPGTGVEAEQECLKKQSESAFGGEIDATDS
jgi:hypothetical protein